MGLKESVCHGKTWGLHGGVESLYGIQETSITFPVNWNLNKNVNKQKTK